MKTVTGIMGRLVVHGLNIVNIGNFLCPVLKISFTIEDRFLFPLLFSILGLKILDIYIVGMFLGMFTLDRAVD